MMNLGIVSDIVWIYLKFSFDPISCFSFTLTGNVSIHPVIYSIAENQTLQKVDELERTIFSNPYEFAYLTSSSINGTNQIILNSRDQKRHGYKFSVDDRNLGGSIHVKFLYRTDQNSTIDNKTGLLVCLSKYRLRSYMDCESGYSSVVQFDNFTISLPYPEMGMWYLSLELLCERFVVHKTNS